MQPTPPSPKTSYAAKVISGGALLLGFKLIVRVVGIARLIVLGRILSPNDFGLFGIAMLAFNILQQFSNTGAHAALIHDQEDKLEYLNVAWTIQLLRGGAIGILLYFGAPLAALFFNHSDVTAIMRAVAGVAVLQGLQNNGIVYFQKNLNFKRDIFIQGFSKLAELIVVVAAAFFLRNAWALIAGMYGSTLISLVFSYWLIPYRPKLMFDFSKAGIILTFGKFSFFESILIFIITQGDDAIVGKLMGTTALGFYQMAYRISNLATTELTHTISRVTFPAYAKIQNDSQRLARALMKSVRTITLISMPLSTGILILAPQCITVLLGTKWTPIARAASLLAIFGFLRSIGASLGPIYLAKARLDIQMRLNILQLIVQFAVIFPLTLYYGIEGTSVAAIVAAFPVVVVSIVEMKALLSMRLSTILAPLFEAFVPTLCMAVVLICILVFLSISSLSILTVVVAGAVFVYLTSAYLSSANLRADIQKKLRTATGKRKVV